MATEPYLSWEDLLAEEANADASSAVPPVPAEDATAQGLAGPGVPGDFELPEELRALFAERERLEQELKELTGEAEPSAEAERIKRMFPVKVHTKESRIEERRQRHRDEQRHMLEKRVLEARQLQLMMELRREQQREELRRKAAGEQRVRERWVRERRAALRESVRRRAFEAAWQARREALHESRIAERVRDNRQDEHAFEAARDAARQRALERRAAAAPAEDDWRGRAFDDSRQCIEKTEYDEHRERLRQRLLAKTREQRELEDGREAQRRAAVGDAMARFKEARARDADRESQRQLAREKKHQERLQEQRSSGRGRV